MADLTLGKHTVGFSIKSFLAIIFGITSCYLAIRKTMPIEAFMGLAGAIVHAYFTKREDPPRNGTNGTI